MTLLPLAVIGAAAALGIGLLYRRVVASQREAYIRHFELPRGLFERLRKRRPELSLKDCQLVAQALRQFFLAHLKSGRQFVSMPSQVVDDLWHEFILYTRNYDRFCSKAFGRFMHHTPAVVLGPHQRGNAGLRRCFWWACKEENIHPQRPTRMPLLFAIDRKLGIADGFFYVPDCRSLRADGNGSVHCGGDFGSDGYDGGTAGFGDDASGSALSDSSNSSDAGGDGSGGSDSGCGGGGCGGGGD